MAAHSSVLAWRIPWTEEPGGLQSMGSQSQTQLKRLSTHAHTYVMLWTKLSELSGQPSVHTRIQYTMGMKPNIP